MAPAPSASLLPSSSTRFSEIKDKDKGVNVQVIVRCRPPTEEELRANVPQVVFCNEQRREVAVQLNAAAKQIDRAFVFDKVFGPRAQQEDIYDQVVAPVVNEVLEGYNCTIFAYGQTGTGKTYTMEGIGRKSKSGEMLVDVGVIPRAVQQIVDILESQNAEYSMKVTFIELYNEEITDLLAPEELARSTEDKQRKPLVLMEDGKGGIFVRGLDKEIVYNANEIYTLLERGSAKRRTAETLLNKQSSRSHSIFSITILIKEATFDGEELIKCGKLNLVDLAGSENISRSGARDGRAREAGEINKSLLTLGRVITALVEHSGHVPYRDSKLTRLLRDSLGGRTKTCIIATLSPSFYCIEETLNTLDYAYRAKNIKNRPEVNQRMMKSALIKDLYCEIEKLKAELHATREKNGVYIPKDQFAQEAAVKKAMADKIDQMQYEMDAKITKLNHLHETLDVERHQCQELGMELENTQKQLQECQEALVESVEKLKRAEYTVKERDFIIFKYQQSENALMEQARFLQSELERCMNDIAGLHMKIEHKDRIEMDNQQIVKTFCEELKQQLDAFQVSLTMSVKQNQEHLQSVQGHIENFKANKDEVAQALHVNVSTLKETISLGLKNINSLVQCHGKDSTSAFEKLNITVSAHTHRLQEFISTSISETEAMVGCLQKTLVKQQDEITSFLCQEEENSQESVDAIDEVSKKIVTFYKLHDSNTSALQEHVLDSDKVLQRTLNELQDSYQEASKREEQLVIEKIAEMVAAANARKIDIVNSKINHLRESSLKSSQVAHNNIRELQDTASDSEKLWQTFMDRVKTDISRSSANLTAHHSCTKTVLVDCAKMATKAGEQWKKTEESVQHIVEDTVHAVDSIIKEGVYGNRMLLSNMEGWQSSLESDVHDNGNAVTGSIDRSLEADTASVTAMMAHVDLETAYITEFRDSVSSRTCNIQLLASYAFDEAYQEDELAGATPVKRSVEVASKAFIEALRAPDIKDLVQQFREELQQSPEKSVAADHQTGNKANKELKMVTLENSYSRLEKERRMPLGTVN